MGVMEAADERGRLQREHAKISQDARGECPAVRQALSDGRLKGNETFPARATVTLGGIDFMHEIKGEIELG